MNQAPQSTGNPVEPKPPSTPPKLWTILVGVSVAWLATLFLAYEASFGTLAGGIFLIFLFGFPSHLFVLLRAERRFETYREGAGLPHDPDISYRSFGHF